MEISEVVKNCGVVGAGGAGFPTHIKVSAKVDTVIANGAECEPLLGSDKYLMEVESDRIVNGLEYVMGVCGAKKGFIAIKEKYSQPIESMSKAVHHKENIEIFKEGDFYPAGDEYILVNEITGKIIPEGSIPLKVGCVVNNVETILNIFEAVKNNKPVTRRWLTCTGEVAKPSIIKAHIGVAINDIIDICGGPTIDDYTVIIGGPMMGKVETDLDTPITKTTNGIIVLPRSHEVVRKKTMPTVFIIKQSKSVCCQCTYCTELCPRYLLGHDLKPHMIMRQISYGIAIPKKVIENAFLCSECGLCEYACVMGLSPSIINHKIKEDLLKEGYRPSFPEREINVHDMRDYRKIPTSRIVDRLQLNKYNKGNLNRGVETDPDRVEILLKQHTGEPSQPIVKVGDKVDEGSLIAVIPQESLGAMIHASINGKVTFIDEERIIIER